MVDFRPFQAWRYNPQEIEFGKVIAPPYDVISPGEQDRLYERSPYNCVRLILNRLEETETDGNNRYLRAKIFFSSWKKEKVLIQEEMPCFYLYCQTFRGLRDESAKTRSALLGRLRLEAFEKGSVIPHEKTLSQPREDRRKLLETTQTNFSPIFGLYEDPSQEISPLFLKIKERPALIEAADDRGVTHRLWTIDKPNWIEQIHKILQDRSIYIADGHHRYQTALDYSRSIRSRTTGAAESAELPSDFVLSALVEFQDQGLVLLPTHRLILPYPDFETSRALKALGQYFHVKTAAAEELKTWSRQTVPFKDWLKTPPSLGLILDGRSYQLTLADLESAKKILPPGKAPIWYRLEVSILSHLILEQLWNLPQDKWEGALRYTHDENEAESAVSRRTAKAAFLLQALPVEILREAGETRELMPQKSTYFYPKLASGLVFYSHLRNGEVSDGHTLSAR